MAQHFDSRNFERNARAFASANFAKRTKRDCEPSIASRLFWQIAKIALKQAWYMTLAFLIVPCATPGRVPYKAGVSKTVDLLAQTAGAAANIFALHLKGKAVEFRMSIASIWADNGSNEVTK